MCPGNAVQEGIESLRIRKAKEHSCDLGCFLETASAKLGENMSSITNLHLFPPCLFIFHFPPDSPSRWSQSSVQDVNYFPFQTVFIKKVQLSVSSPSNASSYPWVAKAPGYYCRITLSWLLETAWHPMALTEHLCQRDSLVCVFLGHWSWLFLFKVTREGGSCSVGFKEACVIVLPFHHN